MKKIFCIFSILFILCSTVAFCFASDSVGSGVDHTYYYSSLPLTFRADWLHMLANPSTTEITINDLGSTYYDTSGYPSTSLTFDNYYYNDGSLVTASGFNGYYTDYIFDHTGTMSNLSFSSSSFAFDINNTPQPRVRFCVSASEYDFLVYFTDISYSLNLTCIDLYDDSKSIVSVPFSGYYTWDAEEDPWQELTIRGEQYYARYFNIFDIFDQVLLDIADNDQYDYTIGDFVQVTDLSITNIKPVSTNINDKFILRYYDSSASTTDKQADYSIAIQNRLYDLSASQEVEFSFREFFFTTVGGWFDFPIIPGITIGAIFAFLVGLALLIAFLKAFAGG